MIGKEIYKIWAPKSKWQGWVRPVLFVGLDMDNVKDEYFSRNLDEILYKEHINKETAFIIDLPGAESVKEGLSLAKLGVRPITIYNGPDEQLGATANVDNSPLELAVLWGADILKDISFDEDAPPAFLFDSTRMNLIRKDRTVYDNSWYVYEQDMPSAKYLLDNGIKRVILVSDNEKIRKDTNKLLYTYKTKGLEILHTDGFKEPVKAKIKKTKKEID